MSKQKYIAIYNQHKNVWSLTWMRWAFRFIVSRSRQSIYDIGNNSALYTLSTDAQAVEINRI